MKPNFLFGVSVQLLDKTQPDSVAHSTDSDVCTFYFATKMVQCLRPILQNIGFQVSDAPTPKYENIQPTIDIIKPNLLTSRVKHIEYGDYTLCVKKISRQDIWIIAERPTQASHL